MQITKLHDFVAAVLARIGAPAFRFLAYNHRNMPLFRIAADAGGFQVRSTSYYEPTYAADHLPETLNGERHLPGIDFNEVGQLALLRQLTWGDELKSIQISKMSPRGVGIDKSNFGYGDA